MSAAKSFKVQRALMGRAVEKLWLGLRMRLRRNCEST
jgi:hypothetical protein